MPKLRVLQYSITGNTMGIDITTMKITIKKVTSYMYQLRAGRSNPSSSASPTLTAGLTAYCWTPTESLKEMPTLNNNPWMNTGCAAPHG